jgi:capsular polysaccharide biosynthesis protein
VEASLIIIPKDIVFPDGYRVIPQIGVNDYCEILKSNRIARSVIRKLKQKGKKFSFLFSPSSVDSVRESILVKPVFESNVINLYVRRQDPMEAKEIVNTLISVFLDEQAKLMGMSSSNPHKFSFSDVRVLDEGRDGKLIKPNVKLNLALGVLVGLVLGVGGILLVEHLNFNKEV